MTLRRPSKRLLNTRQAVWFDAVSEASHNRIRSFGELLMVGDKNDEEWLGLCKVAAKEHDPKKLRALIAEITRLFAAKEPRLKQHSP
jgi:hypothetical protein